MILVHIEWLTFAVSVVLPALVALVTKATASPRIKAIALAALAAVTGVVTQLIQAGGVFHWQASVFLFVTSFITAVVVHFGLLAPIGVTGSEGVIARKVPGGVGTATSDVESPGGP